MDDGGRDPLEVLREEYEAGNPQALLDALRFALSREPAAGWAWEAVHSAMIRWSNGETREFAEPWGLVRPRHWRQARQQRESEPHPEHSYLSLPGAVVRRIAELIDAGEKRRADEFGSVFTAVADEFARDGVSAAMARKWWYSDQNTLRPLDSQNPPNT